MFDTSSRYATIPTAPLTLTEADGTEREVRYLRRRFVPPAGEMTTLVEHIVVEGDRLDNISARYLDDPRQFWRVCDAGNVLRPEELTEDVGRVISIALPEG